MVSVALLGKLSKSPFLWITTCLIALAGCRGNRWDIDTSNIKADVKVGRFEKAVFSLDSANWKVQFAELKKQYPEMLEMVMENLLHFGKVDDSAAQRRFMKIYVYDRYLRDSLYPDILKKYPDEKIHKLEDDLEESFKRIKYFYPKDSLRKVYTFVSAYGYKAVTFDSVLGLSLDMFMGEDYRYYPSLDFPEYQIRKLREEYILPETVKAVFMAKYDEDKLTDNSMLSQMLYLGKQDYFAKVMAPNVNDTLIFGYTAKQMKWCADNEYQMWDHFVNGKDSRGNALLYSSDQYTLAKYLTDGPSTAAENVPMESALRLGEWLGYKIIEKYMDENPEISLNEVMQDRDYKKILQKSKYKPK